jgi:membrane protease YdiL (CAAX protease family)
MKNLYLKTGIFVLIVLIITSLLAILQQAINLDFEIITLPQLAPAIGFLVVALIFKDLAFSVNFNFNREIAIKTLIVFVTPLLLFSVTFFIGKLAEMDVKITENLHSILPAVIIGILIGAVGEEIGWRGFLQPLLQKKHTILIASIIVGIIWGLWHIGHYKNGIFFMIGFLLFTISASIIIAWLLRETQFNIIIAAVFHIAINLGFVVFFKNSLTDYKLMVINGIVWLTPAIVLTFKELQHFK